MSYSCSSCGHYVRTGESHSCYTPNDQTTVSQTYIDSLNENIRQLHTKLESERLERLRLTQGWVDECAKNNLLLTKIDRIITLVEEAYTQGFYRSQQPGVDSDDRVNQWLESRAYKELKRG